MGPLGPLPWKVMGHILKSWDNDTGPTMNLRILFSRIALKYIFTYIIKRWSDFAILQGFCFCKTSHMQIFAKTKPAYAKFRENKTLTKISELTVLHVRSSEGLDSAPDNFDCHQFGYWSQ